MWYGYRESILPGGASIDVLIGVVDADVANVRLGSEDLRPASRLVPKLEQSKTFMA